MPHRAGSLGTVTYVSPGPQQIGVKWDSGRTLMLVAGTDKFEIVTPHRVVLIEDNSYARYDVFVEATDPDQAGRHRPRDGRGRQGRRPDPALPGRRAPLRHRRHRRGREECGFSEEHEHDGVVVPDLLKARDTCADVIESIDDFAVLCGRNQHTDTGEVWDLLNRIRTTLFEALPKHLQDEATAYLEERATTAEREDAIEADYAQHAMTVSA